jgi:catechol 2,3-dioxygenase-like lactoylglutathione lyase family enzyme
MIPAMSTPPRILHLAIRSRDIPRATRFYAEGLGFTVIGPRPSGSGSMDLTDGHMNLTIVPFVGDPGPAPEEGREQIHFGILVDDAAALYRRLVAFGATIARHDVKTRDEPNPDEPPSGSYKVLDPDGNVIDVSGDVNEWRRGAGP